MMAKNGAYRNGLIERKPRQLDPPARFSERLAYWRLERRRARTIRRARKERGEWSGVPGPSLVDFVERRRREST